MVWDEALARLEREEEKRMSKVRDRCPKCGRFAKMESDEQITDIICRKCGITRLS